MKLDNKLFKNLKKKNVNFITIDGITCSGKSLFAELLKKNLKNFIEEEQVRGTIIISIEGINGTISFKPTKYKKVKNKILNLLNIIFNYIILNKIT